MLYNNVLMILRSFKEKDLDKLEDFLASPYFNKKGEALLLAQYLIKNALNSSEQISKEAIYAAIFPQKEYENSRLRRVLKHLYMLLEKFISIEMGIMKDVLKQKIELLKYYRDQDLSVLFEKTHQQLVEDKEAIKTKTEEDYWSLYWTAIEYFYQAPTNEKRLRRAGDYLQEFYLLSSLKLLCHHASLSHSIGKGEEMVFKEYVLAEVQKENVTDTIKNYYAIFLFLENSDREDSFEELKALLQDKYLEREDKKLFYDFAFNICVVQINKGNDSYYRKYFELYFQGLEEGILYVHGYLFPPTVKNIVTVGLRLGELDVTEQFLNDYKEKFNPKVRDDLYNYNMAHVFFFQKNYDKALDYLEKVLSKYKDVFFKEDVFFKIDAQRLKVKIFYEQKEFILCKNYLDSFRISMIRKTVSKSHKETNRNFINLLKYLINTQYKDKKRLRKLETKVKETERVADKLWLMEKVEEKLKK